MSTFSQPSITPLPVDFNPFLDGELSSTVPLTESQREIWASVQMGVDANCAYNESQTLKLQGQLNLQGLERAFQALIERHESLRSTCSPDGTTLCIAKTTKPDIASVDLSTSDPKAQDNQIEQLVRQAVETPFDLEHGPLFRVQVIKLDTEDHLVLITAHHIICDGWSIAVIISDLAKLYSAIIQGHPPQLDEPGHFSQYAIACVEQEDEDIAESLNYWLQQFSDSVPVLDFPTDRPRPALRTFNSAREDWQLSPELITQLKHLGTNYGCSFMTTLLAGFEVFISRLTGQSDVIVGVPTAGQAATGQYNLVGHCVNLLPLRTQVHDHLSFQDYLKIRKATVLDAYEHQQFTFGTLVQKLPIPRDPSRIPLIPIAFNIDQGLNVEELSFVDLNVDFYSNPRSFENFELFINATQLKNTLTLECQYNTNLFDVSTIQQRLAEFETLLWGIVTNPTQAIATLPLLPQAERQWLAQINSTAQPYPHDQCVHQMFERQVSKTPHAIAVEFDKAHLTYQELNRRVNQLASYLRHSGVGPEVLVGVCVERSFEMLVSLLAILKAGGAYVPLDPTHPPQRIALILEDAQVSTLITKEPLFEKLPNHQAQVVCLDRDAALIGIEPDNNLPINVDVTHLAYIIYTSGSTGKPKGVQINHGSLTNLLHAMRQELELNAQDTFLSVSTVAFDISLLDLYLPLIIGAKLVVVHQSIVADGLSLLNVLNQSGITFMQATPATWQMLLTAGWQGNPNLKVICAGEALSQELAEVLTDQCKTVWNGYGPTEATVYSTVYRLKSGQLWSNTLTVPIGHPLPNVQTYILDANSQPVPKGVPGELCIGGAGLGRGYLNREQLTAEKFIINPLTDPVIAPQPPQYLYRTGDLTRFLDNGDIEWLGRIDHQVKIRGFRIELGEIEANFAQHSAVQEAIVIAREDIPGERILVGYFVVPAYIVEDDYELVSDIRKFLKARLPEFMVPSHFVHLDIIPLNANGKVDRKSLPKPDTAKQLAAHHVAPRNELEQEITDIWCQVFNQEQIGIYDNFFELGGHSLLAIQIVSRLRQKLAIEILLPHLFESPTVADIAQRVQVLRWSVQGESKEVAPSVGEFEEGEL